MRNILPIIILIFCAIGISCNSQQKINKEVSDESFDLLKERMDKSLKAEKLMYQKYEDEVIAEKIKDNRIFHYRYDSIHYKIKVSDKYYSDFLPLFENGHLHPSLISSCFLDGRVMSVGQFEELSRLPEGSRRRYKLWSWCENMANPCEYKIELLNEKATSRTSTKDFVQNAVIAYVSQCSVIL